MKSLSLSSGEPRMAKMVHATVHENEYQVSIQAVFRKPENLSQSAFYIDESNGQIWTE